MNNNVIINEYSFLLRMSEWIQFHTYIEGNMLLYLNNNKCSLLQVLISEKI